MHTGLIFDCFGVVIADSVGVILTAFRHQDPVKGAEVFRLLQATNQGVIGWQEFVMQAASVMGTSGNALNATFTRDEVKNTELLNLIRQLRAHYKVAMLTNVSTQGFYERFTAEELRPYFDVVLLSGELGVAKPEAAAYELAAEHLGLRCDECIMIDDREEYCAGAEAVGMRAIRYESMRQLRAQLLKLGIVTPKR